VIEREWKFEAGSEFALPDLTTLVPGGQMATLPPRELEAVYYDTTDLRLARWGVTLRHRTGDDVAVWTVKLPAVDGSGGSGAGATKGASKGASTGERVRHEISFPGDDGPVPPEVAALVVAYARREPLAPVARLVTRRVRFALSDADGAAVAEVDDDEVLAFRGKKQVARFREIEVELGPAGLNGVGRAVTKAFKKAGASPSASANKLLRALGEPPAPELPESDADELVRSAMAAGARRLLLHDPFVRLDDDIEAVHQARVATRRMRSDLGTFKAFVDDRWASALGDDLKWLGSLLGAVRDADVLGQRLRSHIADLPEADQPAAARVLATLATSRETAQQALVEGMQTERYVDLLDAVVAAGQSPVLRSDAHADADAVRDVVAKRWRRLRKDATAADSDEALHGVRIAAKRARYAAEAGSAVLGRSGASLAKAFAGVQEVLGDLHDAVVAESWLRQAARARMAPSTAVALGLLIARERQVGDEARSAWPAAWERAIQAWHQFNG
jgi:CHAD domain-containing protein